jgi:amino acid transporter
MGVWGLAASIVNITIGGGIFRLPAGAAAALGPAAPFAYIVCAIAMALIVLCFAEAGSRVSLTGGAYAYSEVAFGPFVGFLVGVLLWVGITAAMSAVSSFFSDALGALVPSLATGAPRQIALIVILCVFALLNIAGVKGASRFNSVMTIAKLLPLLLFVVVGVTAIKGDNLSLHNAPMAPSSMARASAVLIFAFLGLETALVPSGEVKDLARTVPRAIFLAMLAITVLYLTIQIVAQGILGPSLANQKTPLAEAAAVAMGPFGRNLILIGSAISMFGYVGGMTLAVPRMLFAFGRDGFLPSQLAAVHPRFKTPYVAIAVQAVLVIVLAVSGSFERLAIIANGSVLLVYAACCAAVYVLRGRGVRGAGAPFRVPLAAIVPALSILIIAWLLTSLTFDEWKALLFVIVGAVIVYFASFSSRRAAHSLRVEPSA